MLSYGILSDFISTKASNLVSLSGMPSSPPQRVNSKIGQSPLFQMYFRIPENAHTCPPYREIDCGFSRGSRSFSLACLRYTRQTLSALSRA